MKVLFYKSTLPDNFQGLVEQHFKDKMNHRISEGKPAPTAHPAVEAAVIRIPGTKNTPDTYKIVDYEIFDDTPQPPTLEEKKAKLSHLVGAAEQAMLESILPQNKRRLQMIKLHDIQMKGGPSTPEETAFVVDEEKRLVRFSAIDRKVAEILAEIADLTDANIDSYVVPTLEG